MRTWTLLALAAVVAVAACETEADEAGSTEGVATVDVAAIDQTIRARAQEFDDAVMAKDPAAIAALYADDAIIHPPGEPAKTGPAAVQEEWTSNFEQLPDATGDGETESVIVAGSGDLAVETGRYTFSATGPDGAAFTEEGKYVSVWRLQDDGTWKIAVESYSANSGAEGDAETDADAAEETAPSE